MCAFINRHVHLSACENHYVDGCANESEGENNRPKRDKWPETEDKCDLGNEVL